MFCLSKGLGAPIGSMLCGAEDFIREAKRSRILFGGAWRQAGIMAAAGLIALHDGPERLHEDHANARRLAEGIAEATPGTIDPASVRTNMLFVDTAAGRRRRLGGARAPARRRRPVERRSARSSAWSPTST